MATRYAVGTGNWSDVGTWDGGSSLPGAGDEVFANGFTVTIDQDINVASLRTTSNGSPSISAGGGFVVSANGGIDITLTNSTTGLWPGSTTVLTHSATSGTNTLTAKLTHNGSSDSTHCVVVSGAGGRLDISGNVTGSSSFSNRAALSITGNATVNVTGDVQGSGADGMRISSTCTFTLTGNVAASTLNGAGINVTAGTPVIAVIGNITGGGASGSHGIVWGGSGAPTWTVTGTVTAGTASSIHGISLGSFAGTVNVTGTVAGSSNSGAGISSTGAATVSVTGDVTAGSSGPGIACTGAATVVATGTVTATGAAHAIESSSTSSTVRVSGTIVDHSTAGMRAIYARRMEGNWSAPHYWRHKATAGGTVDLVTTDSLSGLPAEDDVRDGVVYGATSEFEGTLAVPDPSLVSAGVPTDDTVGTLTVDPQAIAAALWDYPTADADTADSMGLRLRQAATVDSTGAQLAAFGV